MDNNAITPDNFQILGEPIQASEELAIQSATESDKELGALLSNKGFQRLMAEMQADIEAFKTGAFIKDVEKLGLEEVGKLFVIHQSVASFLSKYLEKVESAAKAVADAERN